MIKAIQQYSVTDLAFRGQGTLADFIRRAIVEIKMLDTVSQSTQYRNSVLSFALFLFLRSTPFQNYVPNPNPNQS